MSALKQGFARVHFRYEEDRYAEDLEQFAAWLLTAGYPNDQGLSQRRAAPG